MYNISLTQRDVCGVVTWQLDVQDDSGPVSMDQASARQFQSYRKSMRQAIQVLLGQLMDVEQRLAEAALRPGTALAIQHNLPEGYRHD